MGKRMEETMKLYDSGVYLVNGNELVPDGANAIEEVVKKTGGSSDQRAGGRKYDCLRYLKKS